MPNKKMKGPCPTCGVDLDEIQCLVCKNNTWRVRKKPSEKRMNFNYHIAPSTARMLAERKERLGCTYDGAIRTILRDYDTYAAIQERQRIEVATGLRTLTQDEITG